MDTKIQKYARRCEFVAYGALVLSIGNWLIKWLLPVKQLRWFESLVRALDPNFCESWFDSVSTAHLPWFLRLAGFLVDGVAVGIAVCGFYFFIHLMRQFKLGSPFSTQMVILLNKIAKALFWFALYLPVSRTLVTLIVSLNNPPGQRLLNITLGSQDIYTLAVSWFFVLLTSLMRESQQLQVEHDATV